MSPARSRRANPPDDIVRVRRTVARETARVAGLVLLVLLVVGGALAVLLAREQAEQLDREQRATLATADDVDDPPPGSWLAHAAASGRAEVTPGAPRAVAEALRAATATGAAGDDGPDQHEQPDRRGHREIEADEHRYRLVGATRQDGTWAVATDLVDLDRQRASLAAVLGVGAAVAALGAIGVGLVVSRRAVRPLEQALALQRRFVADAAHELRAPLTVLHTRGQVLARRARAAGADPELTAQLDALVADSGALGEVVQDLLTAAELAAGAGDQAEPGVRVDLAALVGEVVAAHAAQAQHLGVELRVAPHLASRDEQDPAGGRTDATVPAAQPAPLRPHATPVVVGRPAALRRALVALVDNALGHTSAGGHVTVRAERAGATVVLEVADDGSGLDPARAELLFARFHHGTAGRGRRHGLGLALVAETAAAHGGHVEVDGAPGEGATFRLLLPGA